MLQENPKRLIEQNEEEVGIRQESTLQIKEKRMEHSINKTVYQQEKEVDPYLKPHTNLDVKKQNDKFFRRKT